MDIDDAQPQGETMLGLGVAISDAIRRISHREAMEPPAERPWWWWIGVTLVLVGQVMLLSAYIFFTVSLNIFHV